MATVYSLVCWGGLTGKTASISATTDVATLTNHGLHNGHKLWPRGSMPVELNVLTPVYARSTASNTFTLHPSQSDAIAGTNQILFAGSSSYSTVFKSDFIVTTSILAAYGVDISRYGAPGSERVYDGLYSANAARSNSGNPVDDEVVEFGEAFDEINAAQNVGFGFANSYTFVSTINGIRTDAFHFGVSQSGWQYLSTGTTCFYTSQVGLTIDGLEWVRNHASSGTTTNACGVSFGGNVFCNNIVRNAGTGHCNGIGAIGTLARVYNNIVFGFGSGSATYAGIAVYSGAIVYNNTVTKCGAGFLGYSSGSSYGQTYNNLSVGNFANWAGAPLYTATRANGNVGTTDDQRTFTATVSTTTLTLSAAPNLFVNQQVFLKSDGTLPAVGGVPLLSTRSYYIRSISGNNITISTIYNGAALTFSGAGSGTHTLTHVWATTQQPGDHIDFTDPSLTFVDWANNDFRPAGYGTATPGAQAKMVDVSIPLVFAPLTTDILDNERPNYNNGGFEAKDAGAFEFDHGYGPHPASGTISLTNIVSGSRVLITKTSDGSVLYNDEPGTSLSFSTPHIGDFNVVVRKASASPFYREFNASGTTVADQTTSIKCLQQLDE